MTNVSTDLIDKNTWVWFAPKSEPKVYIAHMLRQASSMVRVSDACYKICASTPKLFENWFKGGVILVFYLKAGPWNVVSFNVKHTSKVRIMRSVNRYSSWQFRVYIQFQLLFVSKILSIFSADIWRRGMNMGINSVGEILVSYTKASLTQGGETLCS